MPDHKPNIIKLSEPLKSFWDDIIISYTHCIDNLYYGRSAEEVEQLWQAAEKLKLSSDGRKLVNFAKMTSEGNYFKVLATDQMAHCEAEYVWKNFSENGKRTYVAEIRVWLKSPYISPTASLGHEFIHHMCNYSAAHMTEREFLSLYRTYIDELQHALNFSEKEVGLLFDRFKNDIMHQYSLSEKEFLVINETIISRYKRQFNCSDKLAWEIFGAQDKETLIKSLLSEKQFQSILGKNGPIKGHAASHLAQEMKNVIRCYIVDFIEKLALNPANKLEVLELGLFKHFDFRCQIAAEIMAHAGHVHLREVTNPARPIGKAGQSRMPASFVEQNFPQTLRLTRKLMFMHPEHLMRIPKSIYLKPVAYSFNGKKAFVNFIEGNLSHLVPNFAIPRSKFTHAHHGSLFNGGRVTYRNAGEIFDAWKSNHYRLPKLSRVKFRGYIIPIVDALFLGYDLYTDLTRYGRAGLKVWTIRSGMLLSGVGVPFVLASELASAPDIAKDVLNHFDDCVKGRKEFSTLRFAWDFARLVIAHPAQKASKYFNMERFEASNLAFGKPYLYRVTNDGKYVIENVPLDGNKYPYLQYVCDHDVVLNKEQFHAFMRWAEVHNVRIKKRDLSDLNAWDMSFSRQKGVLEDCLVEDFSDSNAFQMVLSNAHGENPTFEFNNKSIPGISRIFTGHDLPSSILSQSARKQLEELGVGTQGPEDTSNRGHDSQSHPDDKKQGNAVPEKPVNTQSEPKEDNNEETEQSEDNKKTKKKVTFASDNPEKDKELLPNERRAAKRLEDFLANQGELARRLEDPQSSFSGREKAGINFLIAELFNGAFDRLNHGKGARVEFSNGVAFHFEVMADDGVRLNVSYDGNALDLALQVSGNMIQDALNFWHETGTAFWNKSKWENYLKEFGDNYHKMNQQCQEAFSALSLGIMRCVNIALNKKSQSEIANILAEIHGKFEVAILSANKLLESKNKHVSGKYTKEPKKEIEEHIVPNMCNLSFIYNPSKNMSSPGKKFYNGNPTPHMNYMNNCFGLVLETLGDGELTDREKDEKVVAIWEQWIESLGSFYTGIKGENLPYFDIFYNLCLQAFKNIGKEEKFHKDNLELITNAGKRDLAGKHDVGLQVMLLKPVLRTFISDGLYKKAQDLLGGINVSKLATEDRCTVNRYSQFLEVRIKFPNDTSNVRSFVLDVLSDEQLPEQDKKYLFTVGTKTLLNNKNACRADIEFAISNLKKFEGKDTKRFDMSQPSELELELLGNIHILRFYDSNMKRFKKGQRKKETKQQATICIIMQHLKAFEIIQAWQEKPNLSDEEKNSDQANQALYSASGDAIFTILDCVLSLYERTRFSGSGARQYRMTLNMMHALFDVGIMTCFEGFDIWKVANRMGGTVINDVAPRLFGNSPKARLSISAANLAYSYMNGSIKIDAFQAFLKCDWVNALDGGDESIKKLLEQFSSSVHSLYSASLGIEFVLDVNSFCKHGELGISTNGSAIVAREFCQMIGTFASNLILLEKMVKTGAYITGLKTGLNHEIEKFIGNYIQKYAAWIGGRHLAIKAVAAMLLPLMGLMAVERYREQTALALKMILGLRLPSAYLYDTDRQKWSVDVYGCFRLPYVWTNFWEWISFIKADGEISSYIRLLNMMLSEFHASKTDKKAPKFDIKKAKENLSKIANYISKPDAIYQNDIQVQIQHASMSLLYIWIGEMVVGYEHNSKTLTLAYSQISSIVDKTLQHKSMQQGALLGKLLGDLSTICAHAISSLCQEATEQQKPPKPNQSHQQIINVADRLRSVVEPLTSPLLDNKKNEVYFKAIYSMLSQVLLKAQMTLNIPILFTKGPDYYIFKSRAKLAKACKLYFNRADSKPEGFLPLLEQNHAQMIGLAMHQLMSNFIDVNLQNELIETLGLFNSIAIAAGVTHEYKIYRGILELNNAFIKNLMSNLHKKDWDYTCGYHFVDASKGETITPYLYRF